MTLTNQQREEVLRRIEKLRPQGTDEGAWEHIADFVRETAIKAVVESETEAKVFVSDTAAGSTVKERKARGVELFNRLVSTSVELMDPDASAKWNGDIAVDGTIIPVAENGNPNKKDMLSGKVASTASSLRHQRLAGTLGRATTTARAPRRPRRTPGV